MNYKALNESLDMFLDILKQHKQTIETLRQRNDMLEARVRELEARPLLKYAGIWQAAGKYTEGQLATHAGGLWLATDTTTSTPGTAASGWRLIVKRGHA